MRPVTPGLESFIANVVTSIEHAEVLLLLHRSPETYWAVDAISQQLGLGPTVVQARVHDLRKHALIVEGTTGAYRFAARDGETARLVRELNDCYREQRVHVINAIFSANLTRLRNFADAFRLGGKKEP